MMSDRDLFHLFMRTLPANGSIQFIRENTYAKRPFVREQHADLETFVNTFDDVEHEFLDEELEAERKALLNLANDFLMYLSRNTWPLAGDQKMSEVPAEWATEQPDRFIETIDRIHNLKQQIFENHAKLVRLGRSKLS